MGQIGGIIHRRSRISATAGSNKEAVSDEPIFFASVCEPRLGAYKRFSGGKTFVPGELLPRDKIPNGPPQKRKLLWDKLAGQSISNPEFRISQGITERRHLRNRFFCERMRAVLPRVEAFFRRKTLAPGSLFPGAKFKTDPRKSGSFCGIKWRGNPSVLQNFGCHKE